MSFLRKLVNKATPFRGSLKKDRPTSVGASSTPTPTTPRPQQVQPAPQPQPQQNGTSQPGRTTFRTTTRTEPDGTVTKTIVETRPDGTVITTTETTHPNGKTSTTKNVKQGTGAPAPSSSNVGPPSGSACALNGGSSKAPGPANDVIRQKDRDHVPPPDRVAFPPGNKVRDEPVKDALGKVNRANEAKDPKYSGPPLSFKESDFASIDAHARSCPPSSATNVPALAKYLTSPYKPTLYKVRAIFAWVTANIQYDTKSYFSGSYGPQGVDDVLKKRIAVCAGYAGLVKELCDAAGVVCIVVPGYGRGFGSTPGDMTIERTPDGKPTGHAWNAVLVQGEWRFIDATWGAGNVTPSRTYEPLFTPHWFLTRPTHMIFTHCPRDPVNQLLSPPISEQDFVNLPYIRHRFLEGEGCVLIKPRAAKVAVRDEWVEVVVAVSGLIKAVQAKFTFTMGGVKKEYGAHVVPAFENGRRVVKVRTLCPGKGEGDLEVYGFTEDELDTQHQQLTAKGSYTFTTHSLMLKFHITNSGSGTSYRPLVTPHRLDTFVVLSPLQRDIRMNTTTQFRVAEMGAIQGWKNKFNATTCGNVELCVYTPDKKVVNMVRDAGGVHSVEVKVDRKGAWSVGRVKRTGGGAFTVEFVVEYQCV